MTTYWFKPRDRGYGATPITWQGWTVTVVVMFIIVMTSMLAPVFVERSRWGFAAVGIDVAVIAAFILFSRYKTDGEWRWRWRKS